MKFRICTTLFLVTIAQPASGQTSGSAKLVSTEATALAPSANNYAVLGATAEQEAFVRAQIRVMQPDVYPLRIQEFAVFAGSRALRRGRESL